MKIKINEGCRIVISASGTAAALTGLSVCLSVCSVCHLNFIKDLQLSNFMTVCSRGEAGLADIAT
jgi:hypothetical protein